MKTVFRSEEIAHIWAHRGAPYGRSPGNLSFDGDAIKSYGTVIGRRINHKGRVADDATAAETLLREKAKREKAAELRARRELKERTERNIAGAQKFLDGERPQSRVDLIHSQTALETLPDDLRARFVAAVEEHNAAIEADERKALAEKVAEWLAGKRDELPYDAPTMLRVETPGGGEPEMVTSRGARVPLRDAQRTYQFARLMRARGWHRNGETRAIGAYQLDAVNEHGIVAGCHRVTWAEIERFAASQGWTA